MQALLGLFLTLILGLGTAKLVSDNKTRVHADSDIETQVTGPTGTAGTTGATGSSGATGITLPGGLDDDDEDENREHEHDQDVKHEENQDKSHFELNEHGIVSTNISVK